MRIVSSNLTTSHLEMTNLADFDRPISSRYQMCGARGGETFNGMNFKDCGLPLIADVPA